MSPPDRQADVGPRRGRDLDEASRHLRSAACAFLRAPTGSALSRTISVVERTLREDPAACTARMDFETRDRYRKAVEDLAVHSDHAEAAVATQAVRAARAPEASACPATHVGYLPRRPRPRAVRTVAWLPPAVVDPAAPAAHPTSDRHLCRWHRGRSPCSPRRCSSCGSLALGASPLPCCWLWCSDCRTRSDRRRSV